MLLYWKSSDPRSSASIRGRALPFCRVLILLAAPPLWANGAWADGVGGAPPEGVPMPPAAVTSLELPPAFQERRADHHKLWKLTALEEGPPAPPEAAPPLVMPPGQRPLTFDADQIDVTSEPGRVYLRGNVRVLYREYTLTAEEATIDRVSDIAEFRRNVTLRTPDRNVTGELMRLNLRTRQWEVRDARTIVTPESVERGLLGPVFLEGETAAGAPGELAVTRGTFTTCDRPHPHYEFRVRQLLVYPGRRLIARGATLYVLGHRVLPPQTIELPLRDFERPRGYLPEVGRNDAEGYYVKYARPYHFDPLNAGLLKLDVMSKIGVGTGIDQNYRLLGGVGTLLLYNVLPKPGVPQESSSHLQHSQQFGSLRLDLTNDYRRSSYQYSVSNGVTTTSLNTYLNLSRQVGGAATTLGLNQSLTSSFGTFRNLTANLLHNQRFGRGLTASFGADYLSSDSSSGGTNNAQLNSRLDLRGQGRAFDFSLAANDTRTLSGLGQFAGIARQPEITFLTDTFRFHRRGLAEAWPARLQLSLGRFNEQPNGVNTERALFDLSLDHKRLTWGRSEVDLTAGFRQGFYGDGAAQYVINGNTRYSYLIGRSSEWSLAHIYEEAQGFTPFRFDFPFAYNRLESLLSLRKSDHIGIAFRTGYDLRGGTPVRWQPLTIQSFWKPNAHSLLTLGTSYNIDTFGTAVSGVRQSRFQTVVSELQVRVPDGLRLDLGVRYDPTRSRFAAVKSQLDTRLGSKWRVGALVGYDGFARFNDFIITRDLHCWEISLIRTDHRDWRREQGWQLFLRIKAFPLFDRFGVGQSGQAIDTSVGQVY